MLARRRLAGRGRAWPSNERRWGAGEGDGTARASVRMGTPAPCRGRGRGTRSWPAAACCLGEMREPRRGEGFGGGGGVQVRRRRGRAAAAQSDSSVGRILGYAMAYLDHPVGPPVPPCIFVQMISHVHF